MFEIVFPRKFEGRAGNPFIGYRPLTGLKVEEPADDESRVFLTLAGRTMQPDVVIDMPAEALTELALKWLAYRAGVKEPDLAHQHATVPDMRCPFCGSDNVSGDRFEVFPGTASQSSECLDCASVWEKHYVATHYVETPHA